MFTKVHNCKNIIVKKLSGYIVIVVVMNFHQNVSIAKIFSVKFPGIFTNTFEHKQIPVYD